MADVEESAARATALGGEIITGPKDMGGHGRFCVIHGPGGAAAALFEP